MDESIRSRNTKSCFKAWRSRPSQCPCIIAYTSPCSPQSVVVWNMFISHRVLTAEHDRPAGIVMSGEYALGSFVDSVCQSSAGLKMTCPEGFDASASIGSYLQPCSFSCTIHLGLAFAFSKNLSVQSTESYSRPSPASTLPRCTYSHRRTLDTRTSHISTTTPSDLISAASHIATRALHPSPSCMLLERSLMPSHCLKCI